MAQTNSTNVQLTVAQTLLRQLQEKLMIIDMVRSGELNIHSKTEQECKKFLKERNLNANLLSQLTTRSLTVSERSKLVNRIVEQKTKVSQLLCEAEAAKCGKANL